MDYFSQSPPIVERIFYHLPAHDLENCAQVCKLWKSMSATELKRRRGIGWFFQIWPCHCALDDHGFLGRHRCSHCDDDASVFESHLQSQLKNLRIQTAFCIAFASYSFLEDIEKHFPDFVIDDEPERKKFRSVEVIHARKFLNSVKKTALSSHLPCHSLISFVVAPGIIASTEYRRPVEVEDGFAICGFCFPNIPGVEINHYAVDSRKCNVSDLVPRESKIKCLLAFLTPRGTPIVDKLVKSCLRREEGKVAVGGAIADRTESLSGSIVAFCGENIEASSLIITPDDKTEEKVKNKLKLFKETGLLGHRCVAFMFVCVARGFQLFGKRNFESRAFNSMYPEIPLIGVFGNGEIGVNYLPHVDTKSKPYVLGRFKSYGEKFLHSYTTIFVLLSIKD